MDRKSLTLLAAVFVAILTVVPSTTGTTISTEPSSVVLPDSEGNVQSFVFLYCYVQPAPPPSPLTPHRWILPSGEVVSSVLLRERHTAFVSPTNEPDGTMRQQLTLLIERLSYSDAGTYVCEFDDNDQTLRASAELALEVDLHVVRDENVTVTPGTSQVGLSCEMSLYRHPDTDLQWFHNGEGISNTERHRVSYSFGNGVGQFGGRDTQGSRVSTLVISETQISDSGLYTCAIRGTNVSQDIQLSVMEETDPPPTQTDPPLTPTDPPETTYAVEVQEIGSPFVLPGAFSSHRTLGCFVSPSVYRGSPTVPDSSLFQSQWVLPNGSVLTFPQGRFNLYFFRDPVELPLVINITRVSYADEGVYTCRFKDASGSIWFSNTTELLLSVNLEAYDSEVSAFDNATGVSLSCEMSLYLRPDEDLQWFRGGQLITSGSGRHSITYTDGSGLGRFGGDDLGSSRVSTLVISQPQTSDSGTYTCAIRNTQHSQDLQLTVESSAPETEDTVTMPPTLPNATSNSMSTPPDSMSTQPDSMSTQSDSMSDSSQLLFVYIGSGAALLIIVVVMTVVVLCIAVVLFKKGKMEHPAAPVDPVYEFIPEDRQDSRTYIMLEANIAYDKKPAKTQTPIVLEANVANKERQDSSGDIMTEANPAYDRKPDN